MKDATGEVSMTVVTIVLVGVILALGTWLFAGEDAIGKRWIEDLFNDNTGINSEEANKIYGPQTQPEGE